MARNILVVEDDMAVGNLIATTLETQNYQYHRAKTGAGAVMDALTFRPDVMLLDLGLPDMDGLEVLEQLHDKSEGDSDDVSEDEEEGE